MLNRINNSQSDIAIVKQGFKRVTQTGTAAGAFGSLDVSGKPERRRRNTTAQTETGGGLGLTISPLPAITRRKSAGRLQRCRPECRRQTKMNKTSPPNRQSLCRSAKNTAKIRQKEHGFFRGSFCYQI
ncbi:hypothetical protein PO124_06690 [Bacillus licheniformis]|nr:hypothetical protein [Bacillus licheniformis]